MFYMILSAMDFASDPSNLRRKAELYANLLKRTVPDTQFTRLRTARLLEGFETLSKAVRVILTIEDFDVLAEVQSILIEGLQDLSRVSDPTTGVTIEGASVRFSEAVASVLLKLQQNRDPRVRNALRVIAEAKRILDLTQPMPRLPPVDAIDITTFKPVRPRRRSKKR